MVKPIEESLLSREVFGLLGSHTGSKSSLPPSENVVDRREHMDSCQNDRGVAVETQAQMPAEQTRNELFRDLWSFVETVVQSADRLFPGRVPGEPVRGAGSSEFAELGRLLDLCGCTREVLDLLVPGILVLDGEGRWLLANRTARCLLQETRRGAGRTMVDREAGGMQSVPAALAEAAAASRASRAPSSQRLRLLSSAGSAEWTLGCIPLMEPSTRDRATAWILLLLHPSATVPPDPRLLRQLYGLTAAEARLSARLAGGVNLQEAARASRISIHTARMHLRQLFKKTGTASQCELLQRLLTSAPAWLACGAETEAAYQSAMA